MKKKKLTKEKYGKKYKNIDYKKKYPCRNCGTMIYPCEACIKTGVGILCGNCMCKLDDMDERED